MRQTSSSQEIEIRVRGKIYTDEEVDEYIIILEKLLPLSIGELEVDDFYTDTSGCIWNKKCFEGCPFLFIMWVTPTAPIMVYNYAAVRGLSKEERRSQNWVSVWDSLYYQRTAQNAKWQKASAWKDVIKKMQKHIWLFESGMY
jgi:hypothetical protein